MPGLLSAIPELSQGGEGCDGYEQSMADTFTSVLLDASGGGAGAGSTVQPSRQQLDLFMDKLGP